MNIQIGSLVRRQEEYLHVGGWNYGSRIFKIINIKAHRAFLEGDSDSWATERFELVNTKAEKLCLKLVKESEE